MYDKIYHHYFRSKYNNQPVQIYKCVSPGEKGKPSQMELDLRALKDVFGKAPDKPIAIYCISGNFRSGKSLILGLFLQLFHNNGSADWIDRPVEHSFKLSNSADGVTSGI